MDFGGQLIDAIHNGVSCDILRNIINEARKLSLKFNIDRQYNGGATLLIVAIQNKRLDVIKTLLELGSNPNVPGDCEELPLYCAMECECDVDIMETLIKAGAETGEEQMMDAIFTGRVEVAELMIKYGMTIKQKMLDDLMVRYNSINKRYHPSRMSIRLKRQVDLIPQMISFCQSQIKR